MASSSSQSWRFDVFPSFSGEDVRKSFLSHLLKELKRNAINTFIDNEIERSHPIGPELLTAIRESRISIVIFSKNYASSTWCLNELVEILKCYKDLKQMVIPVFYNVTPSEVRNQTGEFGEVFKKTCQGQKEDQKQRWIQALADVASIAGEDLGKWSNEADMIGKIVDDVLKKLSTREPNSFGDFVGIEDHLEAMSSMLCLGSEEARMIGIVGPSGIGKTTIARALFSQLSSQFHHCAFITYKRTIGDDYGMKLCWEKQFLSEILCQKDIKINQLGEVERRLNHKKVLIVLDDVDDIALLETLVGETGWFGSGSRIIVITQDRQLLKAHKIDLVYEVKFPSEDLALKMLCRSAFRQDSPPKGFIEILVEVAKLAGNLPLGLNVLGSSLRGRNKEEWMEMLRNKLDGKIEKTLRVGYDRLDDEDKDLFLYIACLFNGKQVDEIKSLLGDSVNSIGFKTLVDKSLIRESKYGTVDMHSLLRKLGREIVRAESIYNPGKRRFLVDAKDITNVLTNHTGTETVLGIHLNTSDISKPLFLDEKSFQGLPNLQFLRVGVSPEGKDRLNLPQGLVYLPPRLRLLSWPEYPSNCLPFTFKAEFLVEIDMRHSKIEKLWDGIQQLGSLKKMDLSFSRDLKEIPDLSNAINLDKLNLSECKSLVSLHPSIQKLINLSRLDLTDCESLVSLPPSIQNLTKLERLTIARCRKLEYIPILPVNMEYLEWLNFTGCPLLRNFPQIVLMKEGSYLVRLDVTDSLWIDKRSDIDCLEPLGPLLSCLPDKFGPKHLTQLTVKSKKLKKLWEAPQWLGSLMELDLSGCENLIEFPDLSKTINLESLELYDCKSLVTVPSTIGNLNNLVTLKMEGCIMLESLPTDVSLSSLETLDLTGCSSLTSFPLISWSIETLKLDGTGIEQVPCSIENFSMLNELSMRGCNRLKNVSANIFRLESLLRIDFSDCGEVTALGDAIVVATIPPRSSYEALTWTSFYWNFNNCFKLDGDARELILRSYVSSTVLPGEEVPTYFTHRASGNSLTVTLPQSSLSQELLGFETCLVVERQTDPKAFSDQLGLRWYFGGKSGMRFINVSLDPIEMDHLVMFCLELGLEELSDPEELSDFISAPGEASDPPSDLGEPSDFVRQLFDPPPELGYESVPPPELGDNHVKFEFFLHTRYRCGNPQPCPLSLQRIKRCGVRVLNVSPSTTSSESEYNQQSDENCDVETGRSKKRRRMEVGASGESSNILCGQIVEVPNLELSLPSPLVSSSNNFYGEGASLYPMITEQQDTETIIADELLKLMRNFSRA